MSKANQTEKVRVAITFEPEMFNYYSRMCKTRDEAFSHTVGSVLREVMYDDLATEKATVAGTITDAPH